MSARFFWFLPTTGDSRSIVGGSHAAFAEGVLPLLATPR
jgi:hypothetical protein